jgi:hypothetical protein
MSFLIQDLQNLSSEYLDPISYLNLIAENPKAFNKNTYKKILKNYESTFPLQFFTEVWNKTLKMLGNYEGNGIKVDPKYLCSLVMKYATITDAEIEGVDDFENEISNTINDTRENYNRFFEEEYGEILGYIEDEKLVEQIEKLDPQIQKELLFKAREILIQTDPEIYDTTQPLGFGYANKMVPILQDLLLKINL